MASREGEKEKNRGRGGLRQEHCYARFEWPLGYWSGVLTVDVVCECGGGGVEAQLMRNRASEIFLCWEFLIVGLTRCRKRK